MTAANYTDDSRSRRPTLPIRVTERSQPDRVAATASEQPEGGGSASARPMFYRVLFLLRAVGSRTRSLPARVMSHPLFVLALHLVQSLLLVWGQECSNLVLG